MGLSTPASYASASVFQGVTLPFLAAAAVADSITMNGWNEPDIKDIRTVESRLRPCIGFA